MFSRNASLLVRIVVKSRSSTSIAFKSKVQTPVSASSNTDRNVSQAKTTSNDVDFPELTPSASVQAKSQEPQPAEKPAKGEPATTTQEPPAVVKRVGSGDGDHVNAHKRPSWANGGAPARDRQPHNGNVGPRKFEPSYGKQQQTRRNDDGARPRAGSNRDGDWSKYRYEKALTEETKAYQLKFQDDARPKPAFKQIVGDLFDADPSFSLGHCVSLDYEMGAGIAKLFRQKFIKSEKDVEDLKAQTPDIGSCSVQNIDGRCIFYLVTKKYYYAKPLYSDLEKSLSKLRELCDKHAVKSLALPQIGAGLDQLDWRLVSDIINHVFAGSEMTVVVYKFPRVDKPKRSGSPASASAISRPGPKPAPGESTLNYPRKQGPN